MKRWRLISWASLALIVGCSSGTTSKTTTSTPKPIDPWVLEWTDPTNDTPAYLANGTSGVRVGRDGALLVTADGSPQFRSGEDHSSDVEMYVDGQRLDPILGSNYRQALALKDGGLTSSWIQRIGTITVRIKNTRYPSSLSHSTWTVESDADAQLTVRGISLEEDTTELLANIEYTALLPFIEVQINPGAVPGRSHGANEESDDDLINITSQYVDPKEFIVENGVAILDFSLPDIRVDGPVEDQQAIRSFLFYLRQSVSEKLSSPGPMGLSNDTYNGHIFWDSDVWMFPALAFVAPDSAKKINLFRTRHLFEAVRNAETKLFPPMDIQWQPGGEPARYPWETGTDGQEKTEGPTANGEHQSGGVAWSLDMASALGLVESKDANKVGKAVANYYKLRSTFYRPDSTPNIEVPTEIRDVTGVDEWFEGDNCLYTNAIADWTIKKYLGEDVNMYFPRDEQGLLSHDGDEREFYKQASAPLILWPLEREDLVDDPIAFLDMFEGKEAPNGPAMSLSVYALIRARYGDADQAYETWRESWIKYTHGNPFMLFSEKPNQPDRTYFLTGAAGCLNAVIYGFIGVRIIDEEPKENAKIKLENGKWLVVRPNLPAKWNSVTFRGMQVLGKSYDVHCEGRTATITPSK